MTGKDWNIFISDPDLGTLSVFKPAAGAVSHTRGKDLQEVVYVCMISILGSFTSLINIQPYNEVFIIQLLFQKNQKKKQNNEIKQKEVQGRK